MNKSLVIALDNPTEPNEKSLTVKSHENKGIMIFETDQPKGTISIENLKAAIKEIEKFQKQNNAVEAVKVFVTDLSE